MVSENESMFINTLLHKITTYSYSFKLYENKESI